MPNILPHTCRATLPTQAELPTNTNLVHLADELVDVLLPVTVIATFNEMPELACTPAASGVRQLERPEEVRGLLEVRASGRDLVNKVLNAEDVVLAKRLLDHAVIGERNTLLVDLSISTLVDEFPDRLEVRLAVTSHEKPSSSLLNATALTRK